MKPMYEKPLEPSIPGLGSSSTPSTVPKFLRTSGLQSAPQVSMPPTSSMPPFSVANMDKLLTPELRATVSRAINALGPSSSSHGPMASSSSPSYSSPSYASPYYARQSYPQTSYAHQPQYHSASPLASGVPNKNYGTNSPASVSAQNVIHADQPQKQLLDSIRKQTELLKQRLAASINKPYS